MRDYKGAVCAVPRQTNLRCRPRSNQLQLSCVLARRKVVGPYIAVRRCNRVGVGVCCWQAALVYLQYVANTPHSGDHSIICVAGLVHNERDLWRFLLAAPRIRRRPCCRAHALTRTPHLTTLAKNAAISGCAEGTHAIALSFARSRTRPVALACLPGARTLCEAVRHGCVRVRACACVCASNHTCSEPAQDLVVIGGGPGGYVAAIKAGQLGLKVRTRNTTRR